MKEVITYSVEDFNDFLENGCDWGLPDDWYVNEGDAASGIFRKFIEYMNKKRNESNQL